MTAQHVDDNGLHIEKLAQRLRELGATFAGLGRTDDVEEMLKVIHAPGWTLLPDVFFVNAMLDVAQQTATNAAQQRAALREGVLLIAEGTESEIRSPRCAPGVDDNRVIDAGCAGVRDSDGSPGPRAAGLRWVAAAGEPAGRGPRPAAISRSTSASPTAPP